MDRRLRARVLAQGCAAALAIGVATPVWAHGTTERVSIGARGVQGDDYSLFGAISADGRYVAFASWATNLVPGDTNGTQDVFVHDRRTGTTRRVSVGPGGVQGNSYSPVSAISADGRFVAFSSLASNLVPSDTNGTWDAFVRDRRTGTTRRVSIGPGGTEGNGDSGASAISADGRFVAFISIASNLVPDDTNGTWDVFVRDRLNGTTRRVSLGPGGRQDNGESSAAAISADGRFVAFWSDASNLVPDDTNETRDVFVRDRQTGTTRRVSIGLSGRQGNDISWYPSISADGRFVAFSSFASNLMPGDSNGSSDVFVRDRQMGTTRRVSLGPGGTEGNGYSFESAISADGRFIAFTSDASNLVPGDTNGSSDVFVRDRRTGTTRRVSFGPGGVQGNLHSGAPAISADGRFVAFGSSASNLVPGDTNGAIDVFVRSLVP